MLGPGCVRVNPSPNLSVTWVKSVWCSLEFSSIQFVFPVICCAYIFWFLFVANLWVLLVGASCLHFWESRLYFLVWHEALHPPLSFCKHFNCSTGCSAPSGDTRRLEATGGSVLGFVISPSISRFLPLIYSIYDVCVCILNHVSFFVFDLVDCCCPLLWPHALVMMLFTG
jgi:hypothetical protein